MNQLTNRFKSETGIDAKYHGPGCDYHDVRYVNWLEALVDKYSYFSNCPVNTSDNKDFMKINIREFDIHIKLTYPLGCYISNEWGRIKKEIEELSHCSSDSGLVPTAEERRAEKSEESAQHSLQLLKAEIAALAFEVYSLSRTDIYDGEHEVIAEKMRQLSAD